jgi:peptidoglycan/xylan/chitin deacetylase (PgdA/CDA1 family)
MRLFRPFFFSDWLYPEALFRIKTTDKLLCLTFDDGPHPESTPVILKILDEHNINAIFFCDGKAAEIHPSLVDQIKSGGHLIGNHGFSHLNGCRTSTQHYVSDIDRSAPFTSSCLFRPPYGRLKIRQYIQLKRRYKIVFWDLMPYDFDKSYHPAESYNLLLRKIRPGSVIVLHDQPSSSLIPFLHQFIETAHYRGYSFIIPESSI